jgi:hypothetical protein
MLILMFLVKWKEYRQERDLFGTERMKKLHLDVSMLNEKTANRFLEPANEHLHYNARS